MDPFITFYIFLQDLQTHFFNTLCLLQDFSDINATLGQFPVTPSGEWRLSSHRESKEEVVTVDGIFKDLVVTFTLCRNSGFYAKFMLIPTILLSVNVLLIFWIPPSRPDRTGLGKITGLLVFVMPSSHLHDNGQD